MKKLDQCPSFTYKGTALTMGRLSFPALGTQSAAYQATGTSSGLGFGFDVVLAIKGTQVVLLVYANIGTPDVTQVAELATKAVAMIRA